MTIRIEAPYIYYHDNDGNALDDGKLWFGVPNLDPRNYPVAVFLDQAMTVPVAQPVRTINGYPQNNGTPINLYVAAGFSQRIENKDGVLLKYVPVGSSSNPGISGNGYGDPDVTALNETNGVRSAVGYPSSGIVRGLTLAQVQNGVWIHGPDGGYFKWNPTSMAVEDGGGNSGTVIKISAVAAVDPGRLERVYTDYLKLEWFGGGQSPINSSPAFELIKLHHPEKITELTLDTIYAPSGDFHELKLVSKNQVRISSHNNTIFVNNAHENRVFGVFTTPSDFVHREGPFTYSRGVNGTKLLTNLDHLKPDSFRHLTDESFSPYRVMYLDHTRPDDTGDGLSWATAKKTYAAINAGIAYDILYIKAGVYNESFTTNKTLGTSFISVGGMAVFERVVGTQQIHARPNYPHYFENIQWKGGNGVGCMYLKSFNNAPSVDASLYFKGCIFGDQLTNNADNAVSVLDVGTVVFEDCIGQNVARDGFNYHALNGFSPNIIEINCTTLNTGAGNNNNDNATTAHEAVSVFRIGCVYDDTAGPGIADVNDSMSYNVDVSVSKSRYAFNINDNVKSWIDGGVLSRSAEKDFRISNSSELYMRYVTSDDMPWKEHSTATVERLGD